MAIITKSHNHSHFWIDEGFLFETYRTFRGARQRFILEVPDEDDNHDCNKELIKKINDEQGRKGGTG